MQRSIQPYWLCGLCAMQHPSGMTNPPDRSNGQTNTPVGHEGGQAWRGSINMPSTLFRYPPPRAVAPTPKASSSVSRFSFPVNFFYNFSQEKVVIRVLLPIYSVSTPCQTLESDAVSNTDGMSNTISRQPQSLTGLGFHYLCGSKTTFFWNSFENKKQLLTQVAPNLWKLVVLLPRRL